MVKVKLILSLDELEKAYKEYKKAFRFSGLFFGIHQEIMEDKDFEKYLYFSSDKVECYDIEKHKLFEIDYDDFYEIDLSLKQKVVCMLVTTRNQQYSFECKQEFDLVLCLWCSLPQASVSKEEEEKRSYLLHLNNLKDHHARLHQSKDLI